MYTGSFGPASNRADYTETISLKKTEDETAPAVEEIEITIGENSGCGTVRKLLSSEGLTYDEDAGEFTFTLETAELRRFRAGSYDMGIVLTIAGVREQLFAGEIIILDGIVA